MVLDGRRTSISGPAIEREASLDKWTRVPSRRSYYSRVQTQNEKKKKNSKQSQIDL